MSVQLPQPYLPQRNCAQEMLGIFERAETRYILFRAPLQSGKTGTYQYLIRRMFEAGEIDQAYIICGSHEVTLLDQVRKDVRQWHGGQQYENKIGVLFRQHFKSATMRTRRTLIINDESHLDCQTDQQLHQFLSRHNLSMSGTTDVMLRNQVYIVSVSATPFAEESVMVHGDSHSKARVQLAVDETYYGPHEYHRDGLLRPTFSVMEEQGRAAFTGLVRGIMDKQKYVVIRLREGSAKKRAIQRNAAIVSGSGRISEKTDSDLLLEIVNELEESGVRVVRFTSEYSKKDTQVVVTSEEADNHYRKYRRHVVCLEEAPVVPTIVLLDGRLRCGKRVPKVHIGMTWDSAMAANTDVTLQGLLGRLCGYLGLEPYNVPLEMEERPLIYVGAHLLNRNERATLELSELERYVAVPAAPAAPAAGAAGAAAPLIVPRFANHLLHEELEKKMIRANSQQEVHQCVPIRFSLPADILEGKEATDAEVKSICLKTFVSQLDVLMEQNNDLTLLQKDEIRSTVRLGMNVHLRRFEGSSNLNMYGHMVHAVNNHTGLRKDRVSDGHFLTFCVVFGGYSGIQQYRSDDRAGNVYASIYTQAAGFIHTIALPSRVSNHNGLTHFIRSAAPAVPAVPVPAAPVPACAARAVPAVPACAARACAARAVPAVPVAIQEASEQKLEAAGVYGFTPEIRDTPSQFENQFAYFIGLARSGIGHFGREFSSIGSSIGIRLSIEAYGDNLHVLRVMISRLEARLGVRIHYVRLPSTPKSTHIYLRRIWWEE